MRSRGIVEDAMVVLDLGCGARTVEGAIGTDIRRLPGVGVVCDLAHFPYPFATASVDQIHMNHVLEHLDNTVGVLTEVWRISKRGARVHVRVPHYTGRYAWKDPTHQRCFSSESFKYFCENGYCYYSAARFRIESLRLRYMVERPDRCIYRGWGAFVQHILRRHPTFAERFLAYLVGGIDEIQVTLEVIKTDVQPDPHN